VATGQFLVKVLVCCNVTQAFQLFDSIGVCHLERSWDACLHFARGVFEIDECSVGLEDQ
jgi:hypothetical protein